MFVTFFDTCMVSLAAMFVWRISPYIVFLPWLTVACLDGTYLSSALTKVPQGAWFTITLAAILAMLFLLWRYGKEQQWFAEAEDRFPTSHFIVSSPDGQISLSKRYGNLPVSITRGLGIFFDKAGETTPIVFSQFVLKLTSLPEVIVFFHLRPLEQPSIAAENRFTVSRLAIPNCYRLVVRYGYNDEIITPNLASVIADQVRKYLTSRSTSVPLGEEDEEMDSVTPNSSTAEGSRDACAFVGSEIANLEAAYSHKVLYIVGKEQMKIKPKTAAIRKTLLHIFLWIRDNTRNKIANLRLPTDKLIEVGFVKEI
jgi:KUP system potassium uptake protein